LSVYKTNNYEDLYSALSKATTQDCSWTQHSWKGDQVSIQWVRVDPGEQVQC